MNDQTTTVGAFLKVKLRLEEKQVDVLRCDSGHEKDTARPDRYKYCDECGLPFKEQTKTVTGYPSFDELLDESEERIFCPQYTGLPADELIFISNLIGVDCYTDLPYGVGFVGVTAQDIQKCIDEFKTAYGDLIALIEPKVASAEVVFGVLSYEL